MSGTLSEIYENRAVRAFGKALNIAIRQNDDFASLVEFEYAENNETFSEALKKFLRRYESQSRKYEREKDKAAFRPDDEELLELMRLIDKYGVPIVRAALVSYALMKSVKEV
ncbi:MAG: hypothetical protein QXH42_09625 [Thermoplasmata archaeon]